MYICYHVLFFMLQVLRRVSGVEDVRNRQEHRRDRDWLWMSRKDISTSDSTNKDDDLPVNIRRLQLFVVLSVSFVIGVTITVLTV